MSLKVIFKSMISKTIQKRRSTPHTHTHTHTHIYTPLLLCISCFSIFTLHVLFQVAVLGTYKYPEGNETEFVFGEPKVQLDNLVGITYYSRQNVISFKIVISEELRDHFSLRAQNTLTCVTSFQDFIMQKLGCKEQNKYLSGKNASKDKPFPKDTQTHILTPSNIYFLLHSFTLFWVKCKILSSKCNYLAIN